MVFKTTNTWDGQNQARPDRRNSARTPAQGEGDVPQAGKKIQSKSAGEGKTVCCIPNLLRATAERSSLYNMYATAYSVPQYLVWWTRLSWFLVSESGSKQ